MERVARLRREYTEKKFTVYHLRKLYRRHGVKFKKVKVGKKIAPVQQHDIQQKISEMQQGIDWCRENNYDLLWLDEVMFTTRTLADRAWSPKRQPLFIDQKESNIKATAVVAVVSERNGVELAM